MQTKDKTMAIRTKPLSLAIANVGDSCYLLDHHNRPRECLLYLSFVGNESIVQIREAIESEIAGDDKIPACRVATCVDLDSIANAIAAEYGEFIDSALYDDAITCDELAYDVQILATW